MTRNHRTTRRVLPIGVTLAFVLTVGLGHAQTTDSVAELPSNAQTPTAVFRTVEPPQLRLHRSALTQSTSPPVQPMQAAIFPRPTNGAAQPTGWRLVPLNVNSVQAATGLGMNAAMNGQMVQPMPNRATISVPFATNGAPAAIGNGLPSTPIQYLQTQPYRVATTPAELPYKFPKPNSGNAASQTPTNAAVGPATRTTTWGEIPNRPTAHGNAFSGDSTGISYGSKSMQEPTSDSGSTRKQTTIDSGSQGELEPIAVGSGGGSGSTAKGKGVEPNLNPPWVNRIFPKAQPFWMNSKVWRRFDCQRQKVSAGVRNVISRGKSKRICKDGCNCFDCLRARRIAHRDFGGWVSWGTTYNSHGNGTSTGNDPFAFNNFAEGLLLNQAWLYAERRADTTTRRFDFGYRFDFMFGADGPDTTAFGDQTWDFSWDTGGEYGFALPQAYATIAYDDLFVTIGRFYTIIGYESVMAPENFFYSHSLTFKYNEPFTHTGVLAQYNWNEYLTAYAGYSNGWDAGYRSLNDGGTFLGGIRLDVSDNLNLFYATSVGDPGDSDLGESDVSMHSLVANAQITRNMNYIFQWDYIDRTTFGFEKTNAYSINQHLLTRINDHLAVGTRFEYFRDDDGARIGNGPGDYFDLTVGLNYRTNQNFVLRPEIRYDWFEGAGAPFDDNTQRDQFTFGLGGYWAF